MDFTRLSQVRLTIQRKIKDTTVLNHLLASGHISEDDAGPIKAQYHLGNHQSATGQLLDILIRSQQPGTVQALTNALEAEDYEYLAKLLQFKEEVRPDEHDRGKQILRLYRPYLCRSISALDILENTFSERLINEHDKETVFAFRTNKGNGVAVEELLDRLMTKKSAKEWYCGFLEILKEAGYKDIVEEIEPGFLKDPEGFVAQYDQMCASPAICMPMPQDDDTMECVDYYESDASVNNLSPPPAKCDGFDLSHPLPKCDNPDYCRTATGQPGTSTDEVTMSNLVVRKLNLVKQEVADQSMDDVTTKSEKMAASEPRSKAGMLDGNGNRRKAHGAIGPLSTVIPEKYHRLVSKETLKTYVASSSEYADQLRKWLEPGDIPVITKAYQENVYEKVLKRLNDLGRELVKDVNPWIVNILVDWCELDKWICNKEDDSASSYCWDD